MNDGPFEIHLAQPPPPGVPVVDLHPFSDEVLARPAEFASVWLDAGPIFWHSSIGAYGVARHAELAEVYKDWSHFANGGGIGLTNKSLSPEGGPRSLLLEADPPEHTHSRAIMNPLFSARALQPLLARWRDEADALVQTLVARGRFDAASELALAYARMIVPREIGLSDYPAEILHSVTDTVFPYNDRGRAVVNHPQLGELEAWMSAHCQADRLAPGGWGAAVHAAADRGECTHFKAGVLIRSLITAGVFNTVLAIGNMINAFAEHPEEWERLRADPSLVRSAIEEVMRWDSPGIHFFRTTFSETLFHDVVIPAGSKVLMHFVAAHRDPRRWVDPYRFDITRNAAGHFGFGLGIHQCLGQAVARQQLTAVLEALLRHARSISLDGEPVRKIANISHGFRSLPVEVQRAQAGA